MMVLVTCGLTDMLVSDGLVNAAAEGEEEREEIWR